MKTKWTIGIALVVLFFSACNQENKNLFIKKNKLNCVSQPLFNGDTRLSVIAWYV